MLKHILHVLHAPWVTLGIIISAGFLGYFFPQVGAKLIGLPHVYEVLLAVTVIPFIISALFLSVERLSSVAKAGILTLWVFLIVAFVVVFFAVMGVSLGAWVQLGADLPREALEGFAKMLAGSDTADALDVGVSLSELAAQDSSVVSSLSGVMTYVLPSNFFDALAKGDYLKICFFCALLGVAVSKVNKRLSADLLYINMAVYSACRNLVRVITSIVPIVAFCMVAAAVAHSGVDVVVAMAEFIVCVVGGSFLLSLVLLLIAAIALRVSPYRLLLELKDSFMQIVATQSFTATIPNAIDDLTRNLKISQRTADMLIPFFAILLRAGPALYFGLTVVFIANLYLVPISFSIFAMMVIGAVVAAISSAGSTGGVTVAFGAVACSFVGLPFEGVLVVLLAADEICTIPRAILNLSAAVAVTSVLTRRRAFANEENVAIKNRSRYGNASSVSG